MKRSVGLGLILLAVIPSMGCVTRRYVINSDPPGAMVYRNGQPIGATPVEEYFIYYGKYHFTLVKEGYEPLEVDQPISTPWYQIPGVDFISDHLVPFKIRDVRTFCYTLQPLQTVRHDDVLNRARELRSRGQSLGTPRLDVPLPSPPGSGPVVPGTAPVVPPPPPPGAPAPPAAFPTSAGPGVKGS
jgi:hypothetical protein